MGKAQKAGRKMALLQAYLRGESTATKHRLVQFGQLDTSVEAVQAKLKQLSKINEQSEATKRNTGRVAPATEE